MATAAQLSAAEDAYYTYADYAEVLSVARARSFATACRRLLTLLSTSATKGPNTVSMNLENISRELATAQAWIEAHSADDIAGPIVTKTDFSRMRGRC